MAATETPYDISLDLRTGNIWHVPVLIIQQNQDAIVAAVRSVHTIASQHPSTNMISTADRDVWQNNEKQQQEQEGWPNVRPRHAAWP